MFIRKAPKKYMTLREQFLKNLNKEIKIHLYDKDDSNLRDTLLKKVEKKELF